MRVKALLISATYLLVTFGVLSLLTGCAVIHACRDGLCR